MDDERKDTCPADGRMKNRKWEVKNDLLKEKKRHAVWGNGKLKPRGIDICAAKYISSYIPGKRNARKPSSCLPPLSGGSSFSGVLRLRLDNMGGGKCAARVKVNPSTNFIQTPAEVHARDYTPQVRRLSTDIETRRRRRINFRVYTYTIHSAPSFTQRWFT